MPRDRVILSDGSLSKRALADCAVLTGDLVASTELDDARRRTIARTIRAAGRHAQRALGDATPFPIAAFRGDAWQLVVARPQRALRAAVMVRTFVIDALGEDTRVAVGRGPIEFARGPGKSRGSTTEGDGEAFRLSGRLLDSAGKRRMLYADGSPASAHWDLACRFIDALARGWTRKQAKAILLSMTDGATQADVAARWTPEPVTQPTVQAHLAAAGHDAVIAAIEAYESSEGSI